MHSRPQIVAVFLSLLTVIVIFEMVRKKRLKEEYSLLWLILGIVVFVLSLWKKLLFTISGLFGVSDPNTTLFFFGIFFMLLFIFHFSVRISDLSERTKSLTQKLALLENDLQKTKEQTG